MLAQESRISTKFEFRDEYAWALIAVMSAGLLAAFVSWQVGVFALLFAIAAWWTWLNPYQAVLFFIVIAPLLPLFKVTQTIGTVTLLKDVLIITLFLKLFLWPLLTKRLPYRRNILFLPLIALALWLVVGLAQAPHITLGILRLRDVSLYALLYLAILFLPINKQQYRTLGIWFFLSVAVTGWLAVFQWWQAPDSAVLRFDPARQIWIPRVSSTLGHPSVFGQYLILASVLAISLFITRTASKYRWHLMALAVATIPLIYFTYSRAVWLGFAAALTAMAVSLVIRKYSHLRRALFNWKIWSATLLALVIILVPIVRFTSVGTFLRSSFDPTYASNQERLEFSMRLLASMSNTSAMFGKGLGNVVAQNFRTVDVSSFDIASGSSRTIQVAKDATLVDNQHLKTFVELGFFGLLIFAWIYWNITRKSWQLISSANALSVALGLWGIGFIVSFVIQGFFVDIWDIFPTNAAFWITAALISRQQK